MVAGMEEPGQRRVRPGELSGGRCTTSVGYGAAFEGLSALLGMLNACSPGVAVVNIDNGYGAGHLAAQITAPR